MASRPSNTRSDEKNAATEKFQAVTTHHAARKVTIMNICKIAAGNEELRDLQLHLRK